MSSRALVASALLLASSACGASQHAASQSSSTAPTAADPSDRFDTFVQRYFDGRFRFRPSEATSTGVHTYDAALEDMSPDGVRRYTDWLRSQRDAVAAMVDALPESRPGARAPQSDHPRLDAAMLRDAIDLEYRRLTEWHELATHPGTFHQLAADAIYQLMVRDFAPLDVRVREATARLRAVPQLMTYAEHWLDRPPRLAVEVALREIGGSIEMVRDIFPAFADRASDPRDREAAHHAAEEAAAALTRHRDFLQNTLLARADGDYHDGRDRWITRAHLSDGVTESPETIRDAAMAEVRRLQGEVRQIAATLAQPGETPAAVLERIRHQHPAPAALLDAYRSQQSAVRDFVRAHDLVTIDPSRDDLTVVDTPPFIRATIFAALSSPGPLEQNDRHTLFYVTPADTTRPPAEIEAYLTEHSNPAIVVTTVHEAYPGHHVQGIHQRRANSLVRQLLWPESYGEGWAHYCEQMVVDAGLGDAVVRLDQRQEALLRAARAYLDVAIHVFGASYEDAVRFYRDEAFLSQPGAEMEAKRVSLEPATVFQYLYGKYGFYRLRAALGVGTPGHPSLHQFHDAVLDFGAAPLPQLARVLYGVQLDEWRAP